MQRGEDAGFFVIGIVARRPIGFAIGRQGAVPFAGSHARAAAASSAASAPAVGSTDNVAMHGVGAAVAEGLIHPHHAVVIRRHEAEIAGRPHIDKGVGPHAGHSVLDHLLHFEVREPGKLAVKDGIEGRILGSLAAKRVQEGLRFMQLVHDGRMPVQIPFQQRPHAHLRIVDVAIIVVKNVLAPVGRAGRLILLTGVVDLVLVIPVDVTVAAVGLGGRGDGDDHAVANFPDQRRVFGDQAVGQLHQHFGGAGFGAMQTAHQVIHRLGFRNDVARLGFGDLAGIGELGQITTLGVEVADGFLRSDKDHDALPAFVGWPDIHHLNTRRFRFERMIIFDNIRVIGQFIGRADVIPEHVFGRRHGGRFRQMVDQRADEFGARGPILDGFGEFVVHLLRESERREG